jgi:hypothetical protein
VEWAMGVRWEWSAHAGVVCLAWSVCRAPGQLERFVGLARAWTFVRCRMGFRGRCVLLLFSYLQCHFGH